MNNRRSRTRFKTDLTVNVTCADIPGYASRARLSDLSVHGLSLILKEKIPVGSIVSVEWGSAMFSGELVYCKARGKEFMAGLKVEDPVYETARKSATQ
jgi:hypothetical protein